MNYPGEELRGINDFVHPLDHPLVEKKEDITTKSPFLRQKKCYEMSLGKNEQGQTIICPCC